MEKELIAQTALQIRNMLSGFDSDQQIAIMYQILQGDLVLLPIKMIAAMVDEINGAKAIISLEGDQVHFEITAADGKSLDLGRDKK